MTSSLVKQLTKNQYCNCSYISIMCIQQHLLALTAEDQVLCACRDFIIHSVFVIQTSTWIDRPAKCNTRHQDYCLQCAYLNATQYFCKLTTVQLYFSLSVCLQTHELYVTSTVLSIALGYICCTWWSAVRAPINRSRPARPR